MNKRVLTIIGTILLGFTLFIAFREHQFKIDSQTGLQSQADVIAVNLWLFNSDATNLQLDFLSKLNSYRSAKVIDFSGDLFSESTTIELNGAAAFFYKIGLIKAIPFSSEIVYDGKKIGIIHVERYNLEIYNYLYILAILILFMILVVVLDRLDHINGHLEIIVAGKTETLKRSEESLQVTLNSIGEGLLAVDENSEVVQLNAVAETILQTTFAESHGKKVHEILDTHDEDLAMLFLADHREQQKCTGTILVNGRELTIAATASPIINNEGVQAGVVYVLSDITEKLRHEESLKHSQKMESIGRLAGGIAHDFNNMLGGIIGAAELLHDDIPPQSQDLLNLITESAQRAAGLTGKLLSFSRKGKVDTSPIDVHSAVSSAVAILTHSINRKIKIIENYKATRSIVLGDIGQLQNCFLNLGINSSHAIEDEGVIEFSTESCTITSSEIEQQQLNIKPGSYIRVRVKDTGCGIPTEYIQNIFEPFFTTKEQGKGTGLGLSAVHGTVLEHNGAITVDSQVGLGTQFQILLPICEATESPTQATIRSSGNSYEGKTILIIDDEPVMRETVRLHLKKVGFTVLTASDGLEGISVFLHAQHTIDLVIVDMIMPGMDGKETLQAIKEVNTSIPVILTSGFTGGGDFDDLRRLGFYDVLAKPYKIANLIAISNSAINSYRQR